MIDLYRFYNDILSKFHFSITGYDDIEYELDRFFNILAKNSYFFQNTNIDFISFAYAKLEQNQESLLTWNTIPLNQKAQFLFHSYKNINEQIIIDLYYGLRDLFSKIKNNKIDENLKDKPTASVIAEIFNNSQSFRIIYNCEKKSMEDILVFEQRDFLLTFNINFSKIIKDDYCFEKSFNGVIEKIIELKLSDRKLNVKKSNNTYTWQEQSESNCYSKIRNSFLDVFCPKKITSFRNQIISRLELLTINNPHLFKYKQKTFKEDILPIVNTILAGAFMSYSYNSVMEYIPGICNVDKKNKEFSSLGALIIGYNKTNFISSDKRTLLKILSDRIASVLSANYLTKLYNELKSNDIVKEASYCFGTNGIKELTHGNGGYYEVDNALENSKANINILITKIGKNKLFADYLKTINVFKNKIDAVTSYNGNKIGCIENLRNKLRVRADDIEKKLKEIDSNIEIETNSEDIQLFINPIEFLNTDLELFISKTKNVLEDNEKLKIKFYKETDTTEVENNINKVDNYIIFYHSSDNYNSLTSSNDDLPDWLTNLKNKMNNLGRFYYINNEISYDFINKKNIELNVALIKSLKVNHQLYIFEFTSYLHNNAN